MLQLGVVLVAVGGSPLAASGQPPEGCRECLLPLITPVGAGLLPASLDGLEILVAVPQSVRGTTWTTLTSHEEEERRRTSSCRAARCFTRDSSTPLRCTIRGFGEGLRNYTGVGGAIESSAPFGMLLALEWGYGFRGVRCDGALGTQVIRISAFRVF